MCFYIQRQKQTPLQIKIVLFGAGRDFLSGTDYTNNTCLHVFL